MKPCWRNSSTSTARTRDVPQHPRRHQGIPEAQGPPRPSGRGSHGLPQSASPTTRTSARSYLLGGDPRVEWLIGFLQKKRTAKVLLICRTREKVLALDAALRDRVKMKVGLFHEDLTLLQRDRNAAWFAEEDGAQILLCSEIGSEGRNFQFAHHLVLFDLPENPELLEQRIGRLDRIGQTETIAIHVPIPAGSRIEALARWYHEGLGAFERPLAGGRRLSTRFSSQLSEILQGRGDLVTLIGGFVLAS